MDGNKGVYPSSRFILPQTLLCFCQSIPATIHPPTCPLPTYIRAFPHRLPGVVGLRSNTSSVPSALCVCVHIETTLLPLDRIITPCIQHCNWFFVAGLSVIHTTNLKGVANLPQNITSPTSLHLSSVLIGSFNSSTSLPTVPISTMIALL